MITSLLLLPRLHRQWRRRLTAVLFLMVLAVARADITSAPSTATTGIAAPTNPIISAPATTFGVGSTQIATATGAPLANLGTSLTATQARAALNQYTNLKAEVDEARRQALVKASQATDKVSRWKALTDFEQAQKDNLTLLRQLHAQVTNLEAQQQAQTKATNKVSVVK